MRVREREEGGGREREKGGEGEKRREEGEGKEGIKASKERA